MKNINAIATALVIPALAMPTLWADPALSFHGGRVEVAVPDEDVGSRLVLLWDAADRGDNPAAWENSHEIAAAVPAGGARYTVDFADLGITNGQPCRLVSSRQYRLLDKLKMPDMDSYIDTGIPDTGCYGIRFGFYGNECRPVNNSSHANFIGSKDETGRFTLGMDGTNFGAWYWNYRNENYYPRPSVRTDAINDVAFTNQVFSLNGSTVKTGLPAGSVGYTGANMFVGTWASKYRFLYGWWSYVRFDDENGDAILDYIPAKRYGDDAVGFYDRATGKFVTSTGGGAFTAGTVTNELFSVVASQNAFTPTGLVELELAGSRLRIAVPPSFAGETLLVVWDDADRGDDPANWSHSSTIAGVVGADGGTWNISLSALGVRDRQVCAVVVAHRLRLLDMLKMTSKQTYVDTGIPDTDCYGVRFGFYGNECAPDNNGTHANLIGSSNVTGCFTLGMNGSSFSSWYVQYRGTTLSDRPTVFTDQINDVVFTNQVFTRNGIVKKTGLEAGSVGYTGANMHIGTWAEKYRFLYGWWSYVRFDDKNGDAILDYIPAQRIVDDTVGFYDRVTEKFVTSTGGGAFTAGTVTNALSSVVNSRQTFVKTDNPTVMTVR